jgi:hypothetical protein
VFNAAFENGSTARSFAADAYDCIMVRFRKDLPNTRLWRVQMRPKGELPLDHWSSQAATRSEIACHRARVRQGQAFGGAEKAPSLTATARDGPANLRSGRK